MVKRVETKNFYIELKGQRGYFEHFRLGDMCGGGLWFKGKVLVDYDGVYSLPTEVANKLRELGYKVPEE